MGVSTLDINKINHVYQKEVRLTPEKTKESGFKRVLDKEVNAISKMVPRDLSEVKTNVLHQGDRILNLLDDYGKGLTDSDTTLKEIEPLVERLETEVRLFEEEAALDDSNDQAFDQLTQDLAVTARVALIKFRRGDFL
jgi:archaellum component FlaC